MNTDLSRAQPPSSFVYNAVVSYSYPKNNYDTRISFKVHGELGRSLTSLQPDSLRQIVNPKEQAYLSRGAFQSNVSLSALAVQNPIIAEQILKQLRQMLGVTGSNPSNYNTPVSSTMTNIPPQIQMPVDQSASAQNLNRNQNNFSAEQPVMH